MTTTESSEYQILQNNSENLIVCFGGFSHKFIQGELPFEFLNFLSKSYKRKNDSIFYVDYNQCWYHKGIKDITTNIDETVDYLNKVITRKPYKKIIFMGVSAGGYASILFGSLCNVTNVISFIPRTTQSPFMTDKRYYNLNPVINNCNMKFPNKTKYLLIGNKSAPKGHHHISHCHHLKHFENVRIMEYEKLNLRALRDNGKITEILDEILEINRENDSDK